MYDSYSQGICPLSFVTVYQLEGLAIPFLSPEHRRIVLLESLPPLFSVLLLPSFHTSCPQKNNTSIFRTSTLSDRISSKEGPHPCKRLLVKEKIWNKRRHLFLHSSKGTQPSKSLRSFISYTIPPCNSPLHKTRGHQDKNPNTGFGIIIIPTVM